MTVVIDDAKLGQSNTGASGRHGDAADQLRGRGVYRYYGDQPFRVLGFPLWMAVTNGLMPLMIGALFNG